MSMNLYVVVNNKKVKEIIQTPTYITYMCLMTPDGVKDGLTGEDAKRGLRCYLEYVKSLSSGVWPKEQEDQYNSIKELINEQIKLCNTLLENKTLILYGI